MWTTVRHVTGVMLVCALLATVLGLAAVFYLVRAHGWLVQTVATGSMEPSVPSGSVIVSRPVDPLEVDVGDVIVFWSPTGATVSGGSDGAFQTTESTLITHRVVSIHGDGAERTFRTKGDGNEEEDPWRLTGDMVRARYVAHVPAVGAYLADGGLRRSLYLAVAALGCLIIVSESRSFVRELDTRRGHREEDPAPRTSDAVRAAGTGPEDG